MVFHIVELQVDEDEAAEDAVVENEIDPVVGVVERDAVLPADEGEAFSKLKEEGLEVVAQVGFEIGF